MKKIVCLIMLTLLLALPLAGCGGVEENNDTAKKVSGIEAVKLLLAEERLNEKLLKNEGDIFENGVQVMNHLIDRARSNLNVQKLSASSLGVGSLKELRKESLDITPIGSLGEEKNDIGKMQILGDEVIWTDLDEVSNSYEYFINYTNNIVSEAQRCADLIDFVKKNIRIVDKWVRVGDRERYYLSVGENEELLCNVYSDGSIESIIVCRRYRNSEGKDVYEMYRSDSTSGYEVRMTYIPGERYELSSDRNQHFIATNTKGYWENYVLGDVGSHYNVSYLILKNNICYTFGAANTKYVSIDVLSGDRETDLFTYSPMDETTIFNLKLNGFDNIKKITAKKSNAEIYPEGNFAIVQWGMDAQVHTTSGYVIKEGQRFFDGMLDVSGIMVMNYAYGYGGEMSLRVKGTPEEAFDMLKRFLDETGLKCSRNIDSVIASAKSSVSDSRAIYNYYQWNGYTVNTDEGIRKATVAEKAKYDAMKALYNNVKNAQIIEFDINSEKTLSNMYFAPINSISASGGKLSGNKLSVSSLDLTISDTFLFVKDEPYRVMIALEDEGGAIVHLTQEETGSVKFADEKEFSVSGSNFEIFLPKLDSGKYRVVAYIATADGIRSSKAASVKFESVEDVPTVIEDSEISAALDESGALTLTYSKCIDVKTEITSDKTLKYDEFKQLVCEAAFKHGTPDEESLQMLSGEEYVDLKDNGDVEYGEYRIRYNLENGEGVFGGYVYVTYAPTSR